MMTKKTIKKEKRKRSELMDTFRLVSIPATDSPRPFSPFFFFSFLPLLYSFLLFLTSAPFSFPFLFPFSTFPLLFFNPFSSSSSSTIIPQQTMSSFGRLMFLLLWLLFTTSPIQMPVFRRSSVYYRVTVPHKRLKSPRIDDQPLKAKSLSAVAPRARLHVLEDIQRKCMLVLWSCVYPPYHLFVSTCVNDVSACVCVCVCDLYVFLRIYVYACVRSKGGVRRWG